MSAKPLVYRYTLIVAVGLAASVLLLLSWPRLQASFSYLPVDTAMSNYWKEREIDYQQLDALIERAAESIELHDHYRYRDGLSELQVLNSQDVDKPFWQHRQSLEQAILEAQEVLTRAPAKPRTWLRIAQIKAYLLHSQDEVISALMMSILTGRVEPTLMLTRLELGLGYLPYLDADAVFLLRDQVLLTWAVEERPMKKRIKDGGLDITRLRTLLTGYNQELLAEMEAL
jgi:hypothetical protein